MQVGKQGYPSYDEANIDLRSSATIPKLGERRRGAAPRRGVGPVSTELALFHG
jgi:hypothetical protein